jgi:hypothetical protein
MRDFSFNGVDKRTVSASTFVGSFSLGFAEIFREEVLCMSLSLRGERGLIVYILIVFKRSSLRLGMSKSEFYFDLPFSSILSILSDENLLS